MKLNREAGSGGRFSNTIVPLWKTARFSCVRGGFPKSLTYSLQQDIIYLAG
jgi:hypothetical protein